MNDNHRGIIDIVIGVFTIVLSLIIGNAVCGWLGWDNLDGTLLLTVGNVMVVGALFAMFIVLILGAMGMLFSKVIGK